jgi:heme-degrading monooxygenase HmoA
VIARIWRGATAADRADDYVEYLDRTGVSEYRATPRNRGVLVLRRTEGDRTEFTLVSLWDSMEAIRAFAGEDTERAVFYPEDDDFLVERDLHTRHYEVVRFHVPPARAG